MAEQITLLLLFNYWRSKRWYTQGEDENGNTAASHVKYLKKNTRWKYDSKNYPGQDVFIQSLKPQGDIDTKLNGRVGLLSLESVYRLVTGMTEEPADGSNVRRGP